MAFKNEPRRERHDLDDAIDRVVREMTRVDTNDDAVARVMARVRGARASREKSRGPWMLSPRAAWSLTAAAALVIAVVIAGYWRPANSGGAPNRGEVARATGTLPQRSTPAPTPPQEAAVARQGPPMVAAAPQREPTAPRRGTHAVVAEPRNAAGATMRATSIVEAANADGANAEAAADELPSDLLPRESGIAMSGIAPAPLEESPALTVEPLGMRELTVNSIDPSPIAVPSSVGPQRGDGDSKGPHTHAS